MAVAIYLWVGSLTIEVSLIPWQSGDRGYPRRVAIHPRSFPPLGKGRLGGVEVFFPL